MSGTFAEMLVLLRRQWKLYPVTLGMIAIAVALFAVTRAVWVWSWAPWALSAVIRFVSEKFGILTELTPVAEVLGSLQGRHIQAVLLDFGAFGLEELWQGHVWRLLPAAFHHGFFLHLVGNLFVLWVLGRIIEERYSRWWYAAFFIGSSILSVAAEALNAQPSVGLSGTGYAMFGFLTIVRLRDWPIRMQVPNSVVVAGVLSMLACLPITWLGLLPIANIAHFSGFGYGMVAGGAVIAKRQYAAEWLFSMAHLLLIPLCLLATHPTWTESYVDYTAEAQADAEDDPRRKIEILKSLMARHPDRMRYRLVMIQSLVKDRRPEDALECALDGWGGESTPQQQDLLEKINSLTRVVAPADQVVAFERVLARDQDRDDVRSRLVAALVLDERRDDAWMVALDGWDGTYGYSQQVLIRQIKAVWRLMPDPESRDAAEVVMDEVFGDNSDAMKDRLDLAWQSVLSAAMWEGEARRAADAAGDSIIDPDAPGSAGFGRQL